MDKEPIIDNANRCLDLRKRAKRGEYLSKEDSRFCAKMFTKYPSWYKETEAIIFNATVPFGGFICIWWKIFSTSANLYKKPLGV